MTSRPSAAASASDLAWSSYARAQTPPVNPLVDRCVPEHRGWRLDVEFGAVAGDARRLPVTPSSSWWLPETSGGSVETRRSDDRLWTSPPSKAGRFRHLQLVVRANIAVVAATIRHL